MKILLGKDAESSFPNLPYARSIYARSILDVISFARNYGYPIVLKVISDKIVHKSDFGVVKKISNDFELKHEFDSIHKMAKKYNGKIMVQEFVDGFEIFVGVKKDKTFGHVIGVGFGGIFVELVKKVSFRICPISKKDVLEMVNESGIEKFFEGFRGRKANLKRFVDLVVKASKVFKKDEIKEVDINPLIVNERSAKIVDMRIILE